LAAHTPLWLSSTDAKIVGAAAVHALLAGMLWFVARRAGRFYGTALVTSTLFAIAPTAAPIIAGMRGGAEIVAYIATPLIAFGCGHAVALFGSKLPRDQRWVSLFIVAVSALCLVIAFWSFRRSSQLSLELNSHELNSAIEESRGTSTSG
jgi:hypothetical protein